MRIKTLTLTLFVIGLFFIGCATVPCPKCPQLPCPKEDIVAHFETDEGKDIYYNIDEGMMDEKWKGKAWWDSEGWKQRQQEELEEYEKKKEQERLKR